MIFHNLCNIIHKIGNKLVEFFKEKAFTLAEIMVALVVIGVITSILLPVAFNNLPNENVMKFKKGNATLAKVVNELVMSDRYYKDGDLGVKADGEVLDGTHEGDYYYFCETFGEILNIKSKNCNIDDQDDSYSIVSFHYTSSYELIEDPFSSEKIKIGTTRLDAHCQVYGDSHNDEIISMDNIHFYETRNFVTFYKMRTADKDKYGAPLQYKVICMDIDGSTEKGNASCDDVKDICPFGYGIRPDGKILLGARAQEWLNKNIQDKE